MMMMMIMMMLTMMIMMVMMMMMLIIMIRLCYSTENITPIYNSKLFCLHFTNGALFLTYGAYQKNLLKVPKILTFGAGQNGKKSYLIPIF